MFTNTVKAEWIEGEERDMRLLEDIEYRSGNVGNWYVPAGIIINGVSIPKILWSLLGSPYVGHARRSSVIHDYHYQIRRIEKNLVDAMFYEAVQEDGVSHFQAHAMYIALQSTGSTWAEYDAIDELPDDYDED